MQEAEIARRHQRVIDMALAAAGRTTYYVWLTEEQYIEMSTLFAGTGVVIDTVRGVGLDQLAPRQDDQ
jgi:hypothetical protein